MDEVICYCTPGKGLSVCNNGEKWRDQQKCHFSEKSSCGERCMHFRWNEYCTSLPAQIYVTTGKLIGNTTADGLFTWPTTKKKEVEA